MSRPLMILDLGSTLVTGPPQGPARRIADLAGLDADQRRVVHRALMTTEFSGPDEAARALGERLGRRDDALAVAVRRVWAAQLDEALPLPGVPEALEDVVARGYRLALLSNIWTPFLASVRNRLGAFFAAHVAPELQVFSCREGIAKPSRDLFLRVLDRAGVDPGEAIMVGDSYDKDMAPALALGMAAIWIASELDAGHRRTPRAGASTPRTPDLTLGSFAAIRGMRARPLVPPVTAPEAVESPVPAHLDAGS